MVNPSDGLVCEATSLLKHLADRRHAALQYCLTDCYTNGLSTVKNCQDYDRTYLLFILAAQHSHPDAAYRAGTCCKNGWGCHQESAKTVQFSRNSKPPQP